MQFAQKKHSIAKESDSSRNVGKLIVDVMVVPSDINSPMDVNLLNEGR